MSKDVFKVSIYRHSGPEDEFLRALEWSLSRVTDTVYDNIDGTGFTGMYVLDKDIKASSMDIAVVIREQLSEFMDKDTIVCVFLTTEWS